jgi:hypothetical protein
MSNPIVEVDTGYKEQFIIEFSPAESQFGHQCLGANRDWLLMEISNGQRR